MRIDFSKTVEIDMRSKLYPSNWIFFSDAPERLYAIGDTSLLSSRAFTVVGSRRITPTAARTGEAIVKDLSRAFTIVTGTADGGDTAAIVGALSGSGKIICLLAGGFSTLPQSNLSLLEQVARRGLLLALHDYDTPVRDYSYEYRNKLLAALGEGVIVLGAGNKSGALITAKYADKLQKPVFALPYPPLSATGEGCNALIKRGAHLTETAHDIFDLFDDIELVTSETPSETSRPTVSLTPDEQTVASALRARGEAHITELVSDTRLPLFKLRAVLSALEVKRVAVGIGGNRFSSLP